MEILPDIVKNLENTELIITGRVEDKKLLNRLGGLSNVLYLGFIAHNKVLELEATSDSMLALYDLNLQTQNTQKNPRIIIYHVLYSRGLRFPTNNLINPDDIDFLR